MTTTSEISIQVAAWRNWIIDMDGVLWHGEQALPGLQTFFAKLRSSGRRFVLATNNATRNAEQYVQKLAKFGVMVDADEVLTSAAATAHYLRACCPSPAATPVFAIGESGLLQELHAAGFALLAIEDQQPAAYVVVGLDREANWRKISRATQHILQGAVFIGTNPDPSLPSEHGIVAGNGAILAAIQASSGVAPLVIGKPEAHLYQQAQAILQGSPSDTVALGDRLETDILGAQRLGIASVLVLTGVTDHATLLNAPEQPTLVLPGLPELNQYLN
jgi:4-nitrophenyl phosphatase